MRWLAAGLFAACLIFGASGQSETSSAGSARLYFTPPDMDGRMYLGVFDASGKLVRTLFSGASLSDFTIGLNGLITTWDGRDDQGRRMPKGSYSARGYVVGDVTVRGEAFHFNDWYEREKLPVADVVAVRIAGDDLIILGSIPLFPLVRLSTAGEIQWRARLPSSAEIGGLGAAAASPCRMAASEEFVAVADAGVIHFHSASTGRAIASIPWEEPFQAMAMDNRTLYMADKEGIRAGDLPFFAPSREMRAPEPIADLSAAGGRLWASSKDGSRLWFADPADFRQIPLPAGLHTIDLGGVSSADAVWVISENPANAALSVVREYTSGGDLLRELLVPADEPQPVQIAPGASGDRVALIERNAQGSRLRCLRRAEMAGSGSGKVVEWEVIFERSWSPCSRFGIVGGRLVANAGDVEQRASVEIKMVKTSLDRRVRALKLRASFDRKGAYVETEDGLRLLRVSERPGVNRVLLEPAEKKGNFRFFQGNGIVVEEFQILHLDQIAGFDCGRFELK